MKKELEQIIFAGKITDTIQIMGRVWTLQTIDITEHTEVVSSLNAKDENLNGLKLQIGIVSKALVSVDDIVLDDQKEKEEFISKLPLAVIRKLFTKYDEMMNRLNNNIDEETIEEIKN